MIGKETAYDLILFESVNNQFSESYPEIIIIVDNCHLSIKK